MLLVHGDNETLKHKGIKVMVTNLGVPFVGQSDTVAWALNSFPIRTSSRHASPHTSCR